MHIEASTTREPLPARQGAAPTDLVWSGGPSSTLVVLSPGGGIRHGYFDAHVPGRRGYSMADALVSLGHAVATVALHPGDAEAGGLAQAGGLADAAVRLDDRAQEAADAVGASRVILAGHSLGGAVALTAQRAAQARGAGFAGLALLGYTPRWSSLTAPPADDADDATLIARTAAALRGQDPALWSEDPVHFPHEADSAFAFAADVPEDVRRHAVADGMGVPRQLAIEYGIAPIAVRLAGAVVGPVLLVGGNPDASDDLEADAAAFPGADVTTVALPGSAHWHAFSSERAALVAAIDAWVRREETPQATG